MEKSIRTLLSERLMLYRNRDHGLGMLFRGEEAIFSLTCPDASTAFGMEVYPLGRLGRD